MENSDKLKKGNVETYTADMVKAIEGDKGGGLIKKIIHEEETHEALKNSLSPKSRKNRLFMLVGILFVVSALAVLAFLFLYKQTINTVPVTPQSASIIFVDQTDFKVIDKFGREQLIKTVVDQVNSTKVKIGGINGIYLTENQQVVGFQRFIALIKGSFTTEQSKFVDNNFLLGAFKSGLSPASPSLGGSVSPESSDFFILLKVDSFTDIFPAMRAWEEKMLYDLGAFFGVNITPTTNYLFTKDWEDGIVGNKNARILRDNEGKIVLMYIFINDSSIAITDSELATGEIILRIASGQIRK